MTDHLKSLFIHVWSINQAGGTRKVLNQNFLNYQTAARIIFRSLFGGENFKFGNPLQTFQKKLQGILIYFVSGNNEIDWQGNIRYPQH